MRETIVRELFAHDREDLAWIAARAPLATITAILDDELAATRRGDPPKGRLTRSALAVLTSEPRPLVPPRSRSPILEMPAGLRAIAARRAAQDELTSGLASVGRTRRAWGGHRITATAGGREATIMVASNVTGVTATLSAPADCDLAVSGWEQVRDGVWEIALGTIDRGARETAAGDLVGALEIALGSAGSPVDFHQESMAVPAEPIEIVMLPGATILPLVPSDADLLAFARAWLRLLEADRYDEALAQLSRWPEGEGEVWTADTLREWINNYASWEPWPDGQQWRVRFPDGEDEWPDAADEMVLRDVDDGRYGSFEVRVPLDGEWSDVSARFEFGPAGTGTGVVLNDVLVP